MPNQHEVGTRFVRRAVSVVAVLIAAGSTASADDARPSNPPQVSTPPMVTYAKPPSEPPLLDNDLQAVPLLGPVYVAVETKYTTLAGGGGLLVGGQAGWTSTRGCALALPGTVWSPRRRWQAPTANRLRCNSPTEGFVPRTS